MYVFSGSNCAPEVTDSHDNGIGLIEKRLKEKQLFIFNHSGRNYGIGGHRKAQRQR